MKRQRPAPTNACEVCLRHGYRGGSACARCGRRKATQDSQAGAPLAVTKKPATPHDCLTP